MFRLATLNTQTLMGRITQLIELLERNGVDAAAIQETRLGRNSWSGAKKVARKKVVLRKQFVRNLEENSTVVLQKRARVLIARKKVRGMKKEVSASTVLQAQMRMALSKR